jgi:monothiol glutaredoxin
MTQQGAEQDPVLQKIDQLVKGNRVMLFMKGNKMFPACGFSAAVVQILKKHQVPFETFNVFADESVRSGIKNYAQWPTLPQLYIDGTFIGGCDIVRELDESGELTRMLAPIVEAAQQSS